MPLFLILNIFYSLFLCFKHCSDGKQVVKVQGPLERGKMPLTLEITSEGMSEDKDASS